VTDLPSSWESQELIARQQEFGEMSAGEVNLKKIIDTCKLLDYVKLTYLALIYYFLGFS